MRGERVRAAGFIVSSGRRGDGTGIGCAFDMFLVPEHVNLELVYLVSVQGRGQVEDGCRTFFVFAHGCCGYTLR